MGNQPQASHWHLDAGSATLNLDSFSAQLNLHSPQQGLCKLRYQQTPLDGHVLGVQLEDNRECFSEEIEDVFVRGTDLVVAYAQTTQRPFSVQVYWRAQQQPSEVVVLDAILSLQTERLESFPGIGVTTCLAADELMLVHQGESAPLENLEFGHDQSDGMLLRSTNRKFSYAEVTHSEDRGHSHLQRDSSGGWQVHRSLGGSFLEKGVIRRLRVRGLFVPRRDDLVLASRGFEEFELQPPPLTV